jgi:hypothetical protein
MVQEVLLRRKRNNIARNLLGNAECNLNQVADNRQYDENARVN